MAELLLDLRPGLCQPALPQAGDDPFPHGRLDHGIIVPDPVHEVLDLRDTQRAYFRVQEARATAAAV